MRILLLASILLAACVAGPYRTGEISPWTPPNDMDADEFISYLVAEGTDWVQLQRNALHPSAGELPDDLKKQYSAYFEPETLESIRYQLVNRIEDPGFYSDLAEQGVEIPLDFRKMDGIAFVDTIAIARRNHDERDWARLLFHESVHVAQYRYLGEAEFMSQYVQGWADNGFNYFGIPLERQAYELDRRFAHGEVFSVEQIVAESLDRSTGRAAGDN